MERVNEDKRRRLKAFGAGVVGVGVLAMAPAVEAYPKLFRDDLTNTFLMDNTGNQSYVELSVSGPIRTAVTTQTGASLTLDNTHSVVFCDASSNAITITLPTASGITGRYYKIKCIDNTNSVTINTTGSETIDGALTQTIILHEILTLVSDGSNWWIT